MVGQRTAPAVAGTDDFLVIAEGGLQGEPIADGRQETLDDPRRSHNLEMQPLSQEIVRPVSNYYCGVA